MTDRIVIAIVALVNSQAAKTWPISTGALVCKLLRAAREEGLL